MQEQLETLREKLKVIRQNLLGQKQRFDALNNADAPGVPPSLETQAFRVLSRQSFIAQSSLTATDLNDETKLNVYNAAFRHCLLSYLDINRPLKGAAEPTIAMYLTALLGGERDVATQLLKDPGFNLTELGPQNRLHKPLLEFTACLGSCLQMNLLLDH
jgi:hypothetical protein